jgi:hypothetical protein
MRDIMDYERIASDALHEIAADRREDLLQNLVTRARGNRGVEGRRSVPNPATATRLADCAAPGVADCRAQRRGAAGAER